jgi:hypothetical protein
VTTAQVEHIKPSNITEAFPENVLQQRVDMVVFLPCESCVGFGDAIPILDVAV